MLINTKNTRDALSIIKRRKAEEKKKIKRLLEIEYGVKVLSRKGYKIKQINIPKSYVVSQRLDEICCILENLNKNLMKNLYNKNTIINDVEIYDEDDDYKRRCKQYINF